MNLFKRKHPFFLIFIGFISLLPALANGSQNLPHYTLQQKEFEKAFSELVTRNQLFSADDVEIRNFFCDPCQLSVSQGVVDYLIISQSRGHQLGKEVITADVLVDGYTQGRIELSGDVHLFGEVVCAAHSLERHQILQQSDLITIRREINMLGPDFISKAAFAVGTELKTTLRPGAIIYKRFLKQPEIVKRGDVVSILAQSERLNIRVPGRIESAGAKGDLVRVKNLMSRKEIYARVINAEEVQVDF
nr:flagellar basal body P-ring formation protein FlgA [Desulfobulbaceae bacterium]